MEIGLNLPVMAPGLDRDTTHAWCRAVDAGPFSSLAVGERINFPNPELTVTLAAAAAWTSRVRLLYNVLILPMHDEVLAAKQVATLDVLSGGRVVLGVGVGARTEDYAAVGAPWPGRLARLEVQVARMRRIWQGEKAVPEALGPVEPFPLQPGGPPILAGSLFPKSIARAAHYADGILGFGFALSDTELGHAFETARSAWRNAGRTTPPRLVTGTWFALGEGARDRMDAYLGRYLAFMGPAASAMAPLATTTSVEALRAAAARARDLGADELVLAPTSLDVDQVRRVEDALC